MQLLIVYHIFRKKQICNLSKFRIFFASFTKIYKASLQPAQGLPRYRYSNADEEYFIQTEKSRRMRPPEPNPRVQTGSARCNRLPKLCCTSAYRQVFFRRAPCFCLENAFLSASSCCNSNICVSRSNQSPRCNSVFSERVYMPWFNLEFLSQALLPQLLFKTKPLILKTSPSITV